MIASLQHLKLVRRADVYKAGVLAGQLERTKDGSVLFSYAAEYLEDRPSPVATSLPLSTQFVTASTGALPPFFTGLLPEGHRLTLLRNATKTSLDDELTLLLAIGADVPGDVQVVPAGESPMEPPSLADTSSLKDLDFSSLANAVDLHGLPGVQSKASASMRTTPLALRGQRYLLKLDPRDNPHLVENEELHLRGAHGLRIPVAKGLTITDRRGVKGLLVERFDRVRDGRGEWVRLPLEDGTQVLGLPPASKYSVNSEEVAFGLSRLCRAPIVATRNIYLQFLFAWLIGNGDLHAKNLSILGQSGGGFAMAPVYDVPCTLLYGDDTLALPLAGKLKNLKARHWAEFAESLGLRPRAAAAANATALRAATSIDLKYLPFTGSPVRGAERELRFRRAELDRGATQ